MARSSYGSRQATTWAVAQKPRPMPRVVRLGRPANDNGRRTRLWLRLLAIATAAALTLAVLYGLRLI